jgi:hypothetical protein
MEFGIGVQIAHRPAVEGATPLEASPVGPTSGYAIGERTEALQIILDTPSAAEVVLRHFGITRNSWGGRWG